MSELKTQPNDANVKAFLNAPENEKRRDDCLRLLAMFERVTGQPPRMWGKNMIGFGKYHYVYQSGREGDWFITGFSPRKQNLTIYIMPGFRSYSALLERLGKHRLGKSCLYLKKLDDIDLDVLETLIRESVALMRERYSCD